MKEIQEKNTGSPFTRVLFRRDVFTFELFHITYRKCSLNFAERWHNDKVGRSAISFKRFKG